jgi:Xaa-Pro aminopeptidase
MVDREKMRQAGLDRIERVRAALVQNELAGVVCTLPSNVLMLSGYRPVVGMSAAVISRVGGLLLIVPEDESELAAMSWADEIRTYQPGSLDRMSDPAETILEPLRKALHDLKLHCAELGYEFEAAAEPAYYSGMYLFQGSIVGILHDAVPSSPLRPADRMLSSLRAVKTAFEVECVRLACAIAGGAFNGGRELLAETQTEAEIASWLRAGFSELGLKPDVAQRADGFAWCMSGPNAAKASGAFASTGLRRVRTRESVLVHANSQVNGYWTDITRTYVLGEIDGSLRSVYEAVFAARAAAFAEIRPGAKASDVDRAARDVLKSRGFEGKCPHPIGHGVGFNAISPNARPMLHPKSDETLQAGMTFNVEPAIYIDGELGVRHCDMVAVTESGMELLTPFHTTLNDLLVNPVASLKAG